MRSMSWFASHWQYRQYSRHEVSLSAGALLILVAVHCVMADIALHGSFLPVYKATGTRFLRSEDNSGFQVTMLPRFDEYLTH